MAQRSLIIPLYVQPQALPSSVLSSAERLVLSVDLGHSVGMDFATRGMSGEVRGALYLFASLGRSPAKEGTVDREDATCLPWARAQAMNAAALEARVPLRHSHAAYSRRLT